MFKKLNSTSLFFRATWLENKFAAQRYTFIFSSPTIEYNLTSANKNKASLSKTPHITRHYSLNKY